MLGFITAQGEVSELKQSKWTLGHSLLVYGAIVIVLALIFLAASIWELGLAIGGAIGIMAVGSLIVIYLNVALLVFLLLGRTTGSELSKL